MAEKKKQNAGLDLGKKASKKDSVIDTKEIEYHNDLIVTCACGAEFAAGSTLATIRVDICSNCHPFFTGEKRILDAEGRVEKFRKKYNLTK